jgi:hypothetical protein
MSIRSTMIKLSSRSRNIKTAPILELTHRITSFCIMKVRFTLEVGRHSTMGRDRNQEKEFSIKKGSLSLRDSFIKGKEMALEFLRLLIVLRRLLFILDSFQKGTNTGKANRSTRQGLSMTASGRKIREMALAGLS